MSDQTITPQLFIRHLSGSKKGQTETFPIAEGLEIRVGRGPDNQVAYDPVKEDAISREHCYIRRKREEPDAYEITDSQSRNGTFVNDQRITGKTLVFAGDIIRLGKDGPSFEFDLSPRPTSHIKKTRVLDAAVVAPKETKMQGAMAPVPAIKEPVKEGIGKQTMMHMLQESEQKSKKGLLITVIAIVLLIGTGAWVFFSRPTPPPKIINITKEVAVPAPPSGVNQAQIARDNGNKVVYIEAGWKLQVTKTGEDLYHVYLPKKSGSTIVGYYAAYVKNSQGVIEPYLVTKNEAPSGSKMSAIGGFLTGSGFVVDDRGFIVTNRHVAESWRTSYDFPEDAFPGLLLETNAKGNLVISSGSVSKGDVAAWVPQEAMNYNRQFLTSGVKLINGVLSYLEVTFANNSLRTPAKVVRASDQHDVAMIKIDLPETLTKVTMYDSKDLATGAAVTVLGYPALSPDQYVAIKSVDAFNRNPTIVKVPVPTLSTGYIGRLVKSSAATDKVDAYQSTMGDYYQLTINSTGPGNSGGPMYDDQGRVIGIFSAGSDKVTYSIPIKYAIELMGTEQVIK